MPISQHQQPHRLTLRDRLDRSNEETRDEPASTENWPSIRHPTGGSSGRAAVKLLDAVAVVIPALDEADSLPGVLDRLASQGLHHIRVVDNGSKDGTAAVARQHGATVVDEPRRGYGQACWTGCQDLPSGIDWILFCNADGSDDLEAIPQMLADAQDGAEMVLGNRCADKVGTDNLTLPQRWGNRLATRLIRLLWGKRYTDLGPLRLISLGAYRRLAMEDRGFGWTVEMQIRAIEEGLVVRERRVENFARTAGRSKISGTVRGTLMAAWVILSTIARLRLNRGKRRRD